MRGRGVNFLTEITQVIQGSHRGGRAGPCTDIRVPFLGLDHQHCASRNKNAHRHPPRDANVFELMSYFVMPATGDVYYPRDSNNAVRGFKSLSPSRNKALVMVEPSVVLMRLAVTH